MKSSRPRRSPAIFCALALLLVAAGPACDMGQRSEADKDKVHVGIVFDIGGKDDRSFNASAWEGVKCAATGTRPNGQPCKDDKGNAQPALGIVLRDVEPGDPTSVEPAIRAFAERNYDLVIGVGFEQMPVVERVAKDYPNVNFVIIDGKIELPNVTSLLFREQEGSYLVGMIAAMKSQTGTVGFIGGMDIPLIHRFEVGYTEGAHAANPNINVIANYVGVTPAAWNNPGQGKELATAQIGKGADVIFTAAGNSGLGAFDAAEQQKKFVIGVDSNQNWVKPGYVLTSMVKRIDNAVYQIVKERVSGQFKAGVHIYGLENGGVGYALDQYNEKLIPPEALQKVEEAKQKIINGEIKVTDAMAK
ncbi:MAG TPA: BMP family ABC transporter substrate-binding protein [Pyrinomonadaceae bacterium]|nr:BMP family ABC transporter substrate-binding protein [Pyrinomonadaceae bacterium]